MKSTQLFPDIIIPDCIINAVRSGLLADISWENDEAPSFMLTSDCPRDDDDQIWRLYVDHQNESERGMALAHRYTISSFSDTLLETNDADKALASLIAANKDLS